MELKYFNISWISNNDGPGRRLVLFLQGCHLNCPWCHSPHSQPQDSPLLFFEALCSYCGNCEDKCQNNVHKVTQETHEINRNNCTKCGACIQACINSSEDFISKGPLQLPTKTMEVRELFEQILPQLEMLREIGGITISGGEPFLQPKALSVLLKLCKGHHISTAVETSGTLNWDQIKPMIKDIDTILLGIRLSKVPKQIDHQLLRKTTSTLQTLQNKYSKHIIVRVPIIPGYTDFYEHRRIVDSLISKYNIKELQTLDFNKDTHLYYQASGIKYSGPNLKPIPNSRYIKV